MKSAWLSAAFGACALAASAQAAIVAGVPPTDTGGVHGVIARPPHRCGAGHGAIYCRHPIMGRRVVHPGPIHGLIIRRPAGQPVAP